MPSHFSLSDYGPPLTCSQKSLILLRRIGGSRKLALLFFSTTNGVLKRILKCLGLSRMPLELTFPRRVSLQTRISPCGYLVTGLTDWVSLGIMLVDLLKMSIGRFSRSLIPLIASDSVLSARRVTSSTRKIISTWLVSGIISRIMTRHCIMSTLRAQHWDSKVKMDSYCIEELYF